MHFRRFTTERVKLFSVCSHRAHCVSVRRAKVACYAIKFGTREVKAVLDDPSKTLPVKKAGSDNTTKWHKFVKAVLRMATILICCAHTTGDAMPISTQILY